MHEMRVHDVRTQRACEAYEQHRIDVTGRPDAHRRYVEGAVEVGRIPPGVVEPDEQRLDAALRECGKQCQQMTLGAADAADPVNVHDSHRARTRSAMRTSAAAARSASRKSHATRYRVAPTNASAAAVWYARSSKARAVKARGAK